LDKLANKYEVQPVALNSYGGLAEIQTPVERVHEKVEKEPRVEISHKKALEVAQNGIEKKLRPEKQEDEDVNKDIQALRNIVARPQTPNFKHD